MRRALYLALRAVSALGYRVRRRFTGAGLLVLAAALAAGVLGIDTERSMNYQAFAFLAALLLLAIASALVFRPRLAVERIAPRLASAGAAFNYRVMVHNQSTRAEAGLRLRDNPADPRPGYEQFATAVKRLRAPHKWYRGPRLFDIWRRLIAINGAAVESSECAVPELAAGHSAEVAVQITPQRRGRLQLRSVTVGRPDPLGIFKACADYPAPHTVLVLPKCYRLAPLRLPGARRYQHGGVALASSVGDSEEFVSLRDYRPGDPLQRVHWKSFARVGHPVVKEYQDEFFERHALVLDTFAGAASDEVFEEAVAVAASFACTVDTQECLLDLMFVGHETYTFTAGRGQMRAQHLLEVLAAVQPSAEGEFSTLAESVLRNRGALSAVILVLLGWDSQRQDMVRRLQSAGVPVLALVVSDAPATIGARAPGVIVLEPGRVQPQLAAALAALAP
jgi:uncharacterized protein (DUF58 family)